MLVTIFNPLIWSYGFSLAELKEESESVVMNLASFRIYQAVLRSPRSTAVVPENVRLTVHISFYEDGKQ